MSTPPYLRLVPLEEEEEPVEVELEISPRDLAVMAASVCASPPRRRVSFWMPRKKPMAQATFSWPFGPIHLENHQGAAQDERFALIFAAPGPHFAGASIKRPWQSSQRRGRFS